MAHFPARLVSLVKPLALPALAVATVAFLAGCHPAAQDPNDPNFVVAEKGDLKVTKAQLDEEVNNFLKQRQASAAMVGQSKMPMIQTAMLRNIVLKQLLLQRAESLQLKDVDKEEKAELDQLKGAANDADFQKQLQQANLTLDDLKHKIHEKVLITKLLEAEAFKNVEPSDQEVNAIYEQYKDNFKIPAKIRVSRVLVHVDEKATPADKAAKKKVIDAALARVTKGEDFSKVAADVSEDQTSKLKGGDLGYLAQGEEPEAGFDDVAFKTKVNTVSKVFLTPLGYEFIKVTESQPAGLVPIADARSFISGKLREQKMEEQEQVYAKKLLTDSGVTYHIEMVDPPSSMAPPGAQGNPQDAQQQQPMPEASASTPPMSAPETTSAPAPAAASAPATSGTTGK